ncbi:MAG: hypothetical protein QF599_13015 [Planctomycetota bacterium]|nr:hypothetical protein [Planctomycetota bacterium]MDP6520570.1 hypothetical protein [Planctomycetota bacterium]MDP6956884.1 hypothetical protein [Planctomycetota bacterium]
MRLPSPLRPGQLFLTVILAAGLHACLAAPPVARVSSPAGVVRADTPLRAAEVAAYLTELKPEVLGTVPHSISRSTEVWVQAEPRLYSFPGGLHADAEGLWAGRQGRIHLREGADDLKRTLAHELVHASLDSSWNDLPGSLEEGLCDVISTTLCPESAARLRAGRLSGAALACGGLDLSLTVTVPASAHPLGFEASYTANIQLTNGRATSTDPLKVFETHAGLSSSSLGSWRKREFYGLSFLLVSRIVERAGLEGLHEICGGRSAIRVDRRRTCLLELAALDGKRETWRRAAAAELGPDELREIALMYPDFIVDTLARTMARCLGGGGDPSAVRAVLSVPESGAQVALLELPELHAPLHSRLLALLSGEGGLVAFETAAEEGEDRQAQ